MQIFDATMNNSQADAAQSAGQDQAQTNGSGGTDSTGTATNSGTAGGGASPGSDTGQAGANGQGSGTGVTATANGTYPGTAGGTAGGGKTCTNKTGSDKTCRNKSGAGTAGGGAGSRATATAGTGTAGAAVSGGSGGQAGSAGAGGYPGGAATSPEKQAALNRRLNNQMAVFDGMILQRRQDAIDQENREGGSSGRHDADNGTGGGYGGSEAGGETPPLLTAKAQDTTGNLRTRGQQPDAPGDNRKGDYKQGQEPAANNDRIPPDIPSGNDDDIVARQLREAAIKEDDPELRAKLWDEYRKYKKGIQASK